MRSIMAQRKQRAELARHVRVCSTSTTRRKVCRSSCKGRHMIEDLELRSLFRTESEEHLRILEEGLLRLESTPTDGKTLQEVFRGAHSLKGSAAMLGLH